MAGTEELMARLSQLENSYNADKQAAREKQFFDTYGGRFANNRGLGLAILNELDARGIDTSAADEAVQQILDQLRTDCQEILDMTKQANEAAIQNAQKVEEIANVVSNAVASNPAAEMPDEVPPAVEPAEMPPAMDTMDPDGEFNPDEVPPAEGGESESAPAEPPVEGREPAPAEPPAEEAPENPADVTSDFRTKRVKRMQSLWGKTRTQKKRETNDKPTSEGGFKPSSGMLTAIQGGQDR